MRSVAPATVGGVAGRSNKVSCSGFATIWATFPGDRPRVLPGISWSAARACPLVARATRHASPIALLTEVLGMVSSSLSRCQAGGPPEPIAGVERAVA